jgi:hypothetical protein
MWTYYFNELIQNMFGYPETKQTEELDKELAARAYLVTNPAGEVIVGRCGNA